MKQYAGLTCSAGCTPHMDANKLSKLQRELLRFAIGKLSRERNKEDKCWQIVGYFQNDSVAPATIIAHLIAIMLPRILAGSSLRNWHSAIQDCRCMGFTAHSHLLLR
mgnify:FL=1